MNILSLRQSKAPRSFENKVKEDENWPSSGTLSKRIAISLFGAREAPYILLAFYSLGFLIALIITSALPTTDECAIADSSTEKAKSVHAMALNFIVFGMATCGALLRGIEMVGFMSEEEGSDSKKSLSERKEQLKLGGRSPTLKLVIAASFLVFAMQSLTYASISFGFGSKFCAPIYLIGDAPRIVYPLRFAYWSFSNPLIVIVVAEVVGAPPWQQLGASLITCFVCLFGLGMEYFRPTSTSWIILLFLSFLCSTLIEVVAFIVIKRALTVASKLVDVGSGNGLRFLLIGLGVSIFFIWNAFPVVFLASQFGGINASLAEGVATPLLDGLAKIALCSLCTALADIFSLADARAKAKVDSLRLIENAKAVSDKERRLALMNFALELRLPITAAAESTTEICNELQSLRALIESPSSSSMTPSAILSKASNTAMEAVSSATTLASVLDDFLGKEGVNMSSTIGESDESDKKVSNIESAVSSPSSSSPLSSSVTSSEGFFDLTRLKMDRLSVSDFFISRICSNSGPLGQVALRKGITLTSGLGRAVPVIIVSDEARLTFLLTLLFQKCISTCPRGGKISARVSSLGWGLVPISKSPDGAPLNSKPVPFIKFSFQDDGLGLEKYELDRVLESDGDDEDNGMAVRRQATLKISSIAPAPPQPPTDVVVDKGVGVADKESNSSGAFSMSLCRAAAGVLGGSVSVVSQAGSGTQFSLKVPAFASMETLLKAMT